MTTASTLRKYQNIIEGNSEEKIEEVTESVHLTPYLNNTQIIRRYQDILMEADLEEAAPTWPDDKSGTNSFYDHKTRTMWVRNPKTQKIYTRLVPTTGGKIWQDIENELRAEIRAEQEVDDERNFDIIDQAKQKVDDERNFDIINKAKQEVDDERNFDIINKAEQEVYQADQADQQKQADAYNKNAIAHDDASNTAPKGRIMPRFTNDTEIGTNLRRSGLPDPVSLQYKDSWRTDDENSGVRSGNTLQKPTQALQKPKSGAKKLSPYARAGIGKFTGGKTLAGKKIDPNERWWQTKQAEKESLTTR